MRHRTATGTPYEPPRWRNRRMNDLRAIAAVYSAAVIASVVLLALAATHPDWLAGGGSILVVLRITLVTAVYVASGAVAIGFAIRRIATWEGGYYMVTQPIRWHSLILWPLYLGTLLLRLAFPKRP